MAGPEDTRGMTSTTMSTSDMASGGDVLVHVGLHKTASTWLQRRLFAAECGCGYACPWSIDELARLLVDPHPFVFDADEARASLQEGIVRARGQGHVPVVSCEELSGNPQSGGYSSRLVAKRLAKVLPEARILLVLREQDSMLRSVYKQYVRMGGAASLRQYFHPTARGPRVPRFRFEHFEYHHLVSCYQELFGIDRVLVLPMERLAKDPRGFIAAICAFAEVPETDCPSLATEYSSHLASTVALQRRLNRIFGHSSVNPGAPFHTWRLDRWYGRLDRLTPRWISNRFEEGLRRFVEAETVDRYERSNALVAEATGVDLGSFGYRMPDGSPAS